MGKDILRVVLFSTFFSLLYIYSCSDLTDEKSRLNSERNLKTVSDPLCGPKNKSTWKDYKEKVDGLRCKAKKYVKKRDRQCPGYRSHHITYEKRYCLEDLEPSVKCDAPHYKRKTRQTVKPCGGVNGENVVSFVYCEREEFIPFCEKKADGTHWGVLLYSCEIPPKTAYPTCKVYKTHAELESFLVRMKKQVPVHINLLVDEKSRLMIQAKEKERLRCLISELERDPNTHISQAKVAKLKESFLSLFREPYRPSQDCKKDLLQATYEKTRSLTALEGWFDQHLNELSAVKANLKQLKNSGFNTQLSELEKNLQFHKE